MDIEGTDDRVSSVAPAPVQNISKINEDKIKEIVKIPNGKEIQEEISLLEQLSKDSTQLLNEKSSFIANKNIDLTKEIISYREKLIFEYSQFNVNEKNLQKPSNYESESDFIMAIEENINLLKRVNKIYTQIIGTAKQYYDIMAKFLDKFINYFKEVKNKNNPIKDFLSEEFQNIVDCWLFMKIDFDKFDFEEALTKGKYEQNFKTFISNEFKKKNFKLDIICPKGEIFDQKEQKRLKEQNEKDKKLLSENKSNLTKLHMENVGNISNYINDKLEFSKLKKLVLENSIMTNGNLFKKAKDLEKLTIKSFPNFQIELLDFLPEKLKELNLEKNNLVNFELETIFKGIFPNNKNILKNLEYLSFAGNNLTRVDLSILSTKTVYNGILTMNFRKNKIYKFIFNPDNFPSLMFIDLCKNNLNKSYLSDIKTLGSLESGNGFLFEPELCQKYYNKLKQKLKDNEKDLYLTKYLNITFMPKVQSLKYFQNFQINQKILNQLKKLDLSYNGLDCDTFFKYVNKNNGFLNLRSLNLNGNELDDTFFEKCLENNLFPKLQHLYLNSNKIGEYKAKISYKDEIPIDEKYTKDEDKELIYKLRLIYTFITKNTHLTKLNITKNPISELYTVVPEPNNNADKSNKYIKRDSNNIIIINCLFSLLIKIRDELLNNNDEKKGRMRFNLRFDCRSNVNKNSENYPYSDKPIVKK